MSRSAVTSISPGSISVTPSHRHVLCAEGNRPRTMESSLRVIKVDRMNCCARYHVFACFSQINYPSLFYFDLYYKKLTSENYISQAPLLICWVQIMSVIGRRLECRRKRRLWNFPFLPALSCFSENGYVSSMVPAPSLQTIPAPVGSPWYRPSFHRIAQAPRF